MAKSSPDTLERALSEARGALGSAGDVQRLRDKLGTLPPAAAPATTSASSGMSLAAKVAAGTAVGVLLIAGAMLVAREPVPERVEPPRMVAPPQSTTPAPSPSTQIAPEPVPAPVLEPAPAITAPRRKTAKVDRPARKTIALETPVNGPKELDLLMSAQDAIEASPQRALRLLGDHAKLYPRGNFAQEREALTIDVLRKLGRTTEAKERARAFIARFPKASNVKHLSRWLDESSARDHNTKAQPLPTP